MAIPTTSSSLYPGDFKLTPIKVHKKYQISYKQLISGYLGYKLQEGFLNKNPLLIGDPRINDDLINPDGTYKQLIYDHINHMYYKRPYDTYGTFEGWNERNTYKFLNINPIVITIPYHDRGEKIKPGSIKINWLPISNSNDSLDLGNVHLMDDKNGNLINIDDLNFINNNQEDGILSFNRNEYILKLDPSELFTNTDKKYFVEYNNITQIDELNLGHIDDFKYSYISNYFNTRTSPAIINNIDILVNSYNINETLEDNKSSYNFKFEDDSKIIIPHDDSMNLLFNSEFVIILDCTPTDTNSGIKTLISKNGIVKKNKFGLIDDTLENDYVRKKKVHYLSEYENENINIYPFNISLNKTNSNYQIIFSRSDGKYTTDIIVTDSLINYNKNKTIIVTRFKRDNKFYIKLFIRIDESTYYEQETEDKTESILNNHAIVFGSNNLEKLNQYSGLLSNIKIIDNVKYLNEDIRSDFYNQYLINNYYTKLNTTYMGNVFYRQGKIVLTNLWNQPNFLNIYKDSDDICLEFESTHTVYQYEILCRIKKGDFNLSQNPSARKHNISDELLDDFIKDGLQPYFTTIGLYNDKNDLVAVAKMAYPIQTRDDVDINVLMKINV